MQRAQKLLECERALVLLIQENSDPVKFTKMFDFKNKNKQLNGSSKDWNEIQNSGSLIDLAKQIALTGKVINIPECFPIGKGKKCSVRSLLGMPIRDHEYRIIGVAEIVNKINGLPFNDLDEQLFEAFTIFCGLGINNTLMYSEMDKALAKHKVAIEVLHYHTTATPVDVENILVLARWLVTVKKNYRNIPYHNWRHAFNVGQFIFAILKSSKKLDELFTDLEKLAMLVGCLSHDLDHRGENNAYQEK
ncbi:Dual 3',5'-cyclic-AMP and -GMP phosphodiesterase 11A [Nymphon striatum]|nr:Dual 3',5'-cyclic-AMP and -GMP phosphodiesterase 11A [Nymphon striatum]